MMYKTIIIGSNTKTFCKLPKLSTRIRSCKQGTIKAFFALVDSSFETNNSTFSLKLILLAGQPFFSLYKNSGPLHHKLNIAALNLLAKIPLDGKSEGFNFPGQCLQYKGSTTERILLTLLLIKTFQFLLTLLIQYKASRELHQQ